MAIANRNLHEKGGSSPPSVVTNVILKAVGAPHQAAEEFLAGFVEHREGGGGALRAVIWKGG